MNMMTKRMASLIWMGYRRSWSMSLLCVRVSAMLQYRRSSGTRMVIPFSDAMVVVLSGGQVVDPRARVLKRFFARIGVDRTDFLITLAAAADSQ